MSSVEVKDGDTDGGADGVKPRPQSTDNARQYADSVLRRVILIFLL